jgi:SAM-dependent methyltransferase
MGTGAVNAAYTLSDHAIRENDRYARAKYHLTLRWLRPYLRPGSILYNIGVGSGYFNHLAVEAGVTVVGCEPDAEAFEAARATMPGERCSIAHADLATFARDREPADLIVMHDVLEHIADDVTAARDLRSLLKPGGRAIVSVPALQSLFGQHDVELGHYRRYSKRTLRAVLAPSFDIRRMQYFGLASIPIVLYFSVYKRSGYPRAAIGETPLSRAYGAVCDFESYLSEPLGTSIITELVPRD